MKGIQTSKTDAFEQWRINNSTVYGDFIWVQINYDILGANTLSIVFEEKPQININIKNIIQKINGIIPYYILNFININSKFYVDATTLDKKMNLSLKNKCLSQVSSYWEYRLKTLPQNCLTCDIDSLEAGKNKLVAIEAAQLFDTNSIVDALPNIFRTFKFRKNEVNENQYLSQFNFMQKINGEAFILFHIIDNNKLDTTKPVFIIKNDYDFYKILCDIKKMSRNDEAIFIKKYNNFFNKNLIPYKNIGDAYGYIKRL